MRDHQDPQQAGAAAEGLALLGRELGHVARTLRYRCQLARIPLAPEHELTYRSSCGSVSVCGERITITTGGGHA